jgi:anti-sigma regulatory factor (Ser/Thr protein kinase)
MASARRPVSASSLYSTLTTAATLGVLNGQRRATEIISVDRGKGPPLQKAPLDGGAHAREAAKMPALILRMKSRLMDSVRAA